MIIMHTDLNVTFWDVYFQNKTQGKKLHWLQYKNRTFFFYRGSAWNILHDVADVLPLAVELPCDNHNLLEKQKNVYATVLSYAFFKETR